MGDRWKLGLVMMDGWMGGWVVMHGEWMDGYVILPDGWMVPHE